MAVRDVFTEAEWAQVLQAPMLAGLALTAADPGGLWGVVKESSAMAGALLTACKTAPAGSLVGEIVAAFETSDARTVARDGVKQTMKGKKPAEAAEAAVAHLGEVAALVSTKAPEEAEAFKTWIREIAERVAEAGTEGGFLGFGGEKVSEAEKRTLAEIDAALA